MGPSRNIRPMSHSNKIHNIILMPFTTVLTSFEASDSLFLVVCRILRPRQIISVSKHKAAVYNDREYCRSLRARGLFTTVYRDMHGAVYNWIQRSLSTAAQCTESTQHRPTRFYFEHEHQSTSSTRLSRFLFVLHIAAHVHVY